jgi:hypothetical protein
MPGSIIPNQQEGFFAFGAKPLDQPLRELNGH